MAKAHRSVPSRKRKNKVLKFARGYRGRSSKCYVLALRAMQRAMAYNYIHRKKKKRDFRRLWIMRINAAVRNIGYSYSDFIMKLNRSDVKIDRKMLAHIAISFPESFKSVTDYIMNYDKADNAKVASKVKQKSA